MTEQNRPVRLSVKERHAHGIFHLVIVDDMLTMAQTLAKVTETSFLHNTKNLKKSIFTDFGRARESLTSITTTAHPDIILIDMRDGDHFDGDAEAGLKLHAAIRKRERHIAKVHDDSIRMPIIILCDPEDGTPTHREMIKRHNLPDTHGKRARSVLVQKTDVKTLNRKITAVYNEIFDHPAGDTAKGEPST